MKFRSLLLSTVVLFTMTGISPAQEGSAYFRGVDPRVQVKTVQPQLAFDPGAGLLLGGFATSSPARYSGPGVTLGVIGTGELRVCETADCEMSAWSDRAAVREGQFVQVRRAGPTEPSQSVEVRLGRPAAVAQYVATASATPPSFGAFGSATLSPSDAAESNLSTFRGWVETSYGVTAGEARICASGGSCSAWGRTGTIRDGDQVQLRGIAGAFDTTVPVTITTGSASGTFSIATRARDTVPDAIAFADVTAAPNEIVSSSPVALLGHDGVTVTVTGEGAEVRHCPTPACDNGTWGQTASIPAGGYLQLRMTAGADTVVRTASLSYGHDAPATWSVTAESLPAVSIYRFTNCNRTGPIGPGLSECRTHYATDWSADSAQYTMETDGIQRWRVPATGTYRVTIAGASGGRQRISGTTALAGGRGLVQSGTFTLDAGTWVNLVVGQMGSDSPATGSVGGKAAGGGGASAMFTSVGWVYAVSGGGGGAGYVVSNITAAQATGVDAAASTNGTKASIQSPNFAGQDGQGGVACASNNNATGAVAGGGFHSNSREYGGWGTAAMSLRTTAVGSIQRQTGTNLSHGGFGAGGSGAYGGGGGGGYSGGSCGAYSPNSATGGGGGGSIFNGATRDAPSYNTGHGYIEIERVD